MWFDEVKLTVQPGLIVQETHYDPWGMELAGIEGRGSPEHPLKFQGKELIDELELYLMDFHARYYDAQLGRWHAVDPANQFGSPYLAMANNPVVSVDPDGEFVPLVVGVAALIGGGQNLWSNWSKVKDWKSGIAYFASGAIGGAVSVANPFLGGSLTVTANIGIDMATGNMPNMSNPGDVAKYAGFKVLEGAGAGGAGTLAKGTIGLTKLAANSLTNWTYNSTATAVAGNGTLYGAKVIADVTVTATRMPVVPFGSLAATAGNVAKTSTTIITRSVGAAPKGFSTVLQSGGHTLNNSTLKALGLTKEQGKIAIEALKTDLRLPANFHGKIMGNGDLVHPHTREVLGNLFDYLH